MINLVAKVVHTTKLVKSVLASKDFDKALELVSYKLSKISEEEKQSLIDLKRAYKKEKLNIVKLATAKRKTAIKCFFGELNDIYEAKELEKQLASEKTENDTVVVF